jgi:hypothetical protein
MRGIERQVEVLKCLGHQVALDTAGYESPASHYPDCRVGKARLKTARYNGLYHCNGVRGYDFFVARRMAIKMLQIKGKTWMVDDPPHWWAMEEHAASYRGRVLVAGLGLGLIVHALVKNPEVTEIKVIERDEDVISLITPHLPHDPRIEIINEDFFNVMEWEWTNEPDGVFYDLFVGKGHDLVHEATFMYLRLALGFPSARVVRIHGFDNEELGQLAQQVKRAQGLMETKITQSSEVRL